VPRFWYDQLGVETAARSGHSGSIRHGNLDSCPGSGSFGDARKLTAICHWIFVQANRGMKVPAVAVTEDPSVGSGGWRTCRSTGRAPSVLAGRDWVLMGSAGRTESRTPTPGRAMTVAPAWDHLRLRHPANDWHCLVLRGNQSNKTHPECDVTCWTAGKRTRISPVTRGGRSSYTVSGAAGKAPETLKEATMRRIILVGILSVMIGLASATLPAWADSNPSGTGPPNQSCEKVARLTGSASPPGHASSSPGSPFNTAGTSGQNYSTNSQYDVACYQLSKH
jgi:hypothetical protein